ncbi:MAG TPA: DUF3486 family protein [Rhizomicrobium sp.]|jgi:hypothetical protein
MARRSKIAQLPTELRQAIDEKLADPGLTLNQLVEEVRRIGAPIGLEVSRSALSRRQQDIKVVGERIRRSRDIAEALVEKFGDADDDKLARLNNQVLHTTIMDMLSAADEDGEPVTLTPAQVMALSKALGELSRARKTDSDRLLKERLEIAKKASEVVTRTLGKKDGFSKETVDTIKREILGLAKS